MILLDPGRLLRCPTSFGMECRWSKVVWKNSNGKRSGIMKKFTRWSYVGERRKPGRVSNQNCFTNWENVPLIRLPEEEMRSWCVPWEVSCPIFEVDGWMCMKKRRMRVFITVLPIPYQKLCSMKADWTQVREEMCNNILFLVFDLHAYKPDGDREKGGEWVIHEPCPGWLSTLQYWRVLSQSFPDQ